MRLTLCLAAAFMPNLSANGRIHRRKACMIEIITNVNGIVNNFVWGIPMLVLLVGTGIFMTILGQYFH